jgi:hypothetical protein
MFRGSGQTSIGQAMGPFHTPRREKIRKAQSPMACRSPGLESMTGFNDNIPTLTPVSERVSLLLAVGWHFCRVMTTDDCTDWLVYPRLHVQSMEREKRLVVFPTATCSHVESTVTQALLPPAAGLDLKLVALLVHGLDAISPSCSLSSPVRTILSSPQSANVATPSRMEGRWIQRRTK